MTLTELLTQEAGAVAGGSTACGYASKTDPTMICQRLSTHASARLSQDLHATQASGQWVTFSE